MGEWPQQQREEHETPREEVQQGTETEGQDAGTSVQEENVTAERDEQQRNNDSVDMTES